MTKKPLKNNSNIIKNNVSTFALVIFLNAEVLC